MEDFVSKLCTKLILRYGIYVFLILEEYFSIVDELLKKLQFLLLPQSDETHQRLNARILMK